MGERKSESVDYGFRFRGSSREQAGDGVEEEIWRLGDGQVRGN